jgi:hypothetical protein
MTSEMTKDSRMPEQTDTDADNGLSDQDARPEEHVSPSEPEKDQRPAAVMHDLLLTSAPADEGSLWFILDTARSPATLSGLLQYDPPRINLFEDTTLAAMINVAPYLVRLEPESDFSNWLMNESVGQSWGIFIQSNADPGELADHFKRWITVWDDNGREMYFRFYDPRVLHVFLADANMAEIDRFFGALVKKMIAEVSPGDALVFYETNDEGLSKIIRPLVTTTTKPAIKPSIMVKRKENEPAPLLSETGAVIMRPEMMAAMSRYSRSGFIDRLTAHINDAYPEAVLIISPPDLRPRLETSVDRAMEYGMMSESDVSRFVDLTFELEEHFDTSDEYAWAGEILRDDNDDPAIRLQKIWHRVNGVDFIHGDKQGVAFFAPDDET